jgi:hypothetical protein
VFFFVNDIGDRLIFEKEVLIYINISKMSYQELDLLFSGNCEKFKDISGFINSKV